MAKRTGTRASFASVAGILLLLSGCAGATNDGTSGNGEPRLVDTKSPVQLLRNDATDRVDAADIASIRKEVDQSEPCFDEAKNPGGLVRQWKSSVELVLADGTDRVAIMDKLIQSFTEQGWSFEELSNTADLWDVVLSSDASLANIEISSTELSIVSIIRVISTGPCVTTDGPDSDEVKSLE
jgi:hypothetical protein